MYIHSRKLLSPEEEGNPVTFATMWMDLGGTMLQVRKRQILYDLTHISNLKKSDLIQTDQTDGCQRCVCGRGGMGEGGHKARASSYQSWGCDAQHGDYNDTVQYS